MAQHIISAEFVKQVEVLENHCADAGAVIR